MRTLRYVLCDVFTNRPLTGNPLAVFTDGRGLDAETMQALAREMNLSETVFVLPPESGGHARIRIFTPRFEMPFAGHPTLGSAFVLGGPLQADVVELETGVGIIPVRLEREGPRIVFGWMRQVVPAQKDFARAPELLSALGFERAELPLVEYDNGARHVIVVVKSPEDVAAIVPDFSRLAPFSGVGIYVAAGSGTRFKARLFAPSLGIEDPATGSAAGPLAVHLTAHGRAPFAETLVIAQGAEMQRPSELHAVVHGSNDRIETVEVGGSAVVLARGELRLP